MEGLTRVCIKSPSAMQDARWAWPLGEPSHYTHYYTHFGHYFTHFTHCTHQAAAYRQNIHCQAFISQSAFKTHLFPACSGSHTCSSSSLLGTKNCETWLLIKKRSVKLLNDEKELKVVLRLERRRASWIGVHLMSGHRMGRYKSEQVAPTGGVEVGDVGCDGN